MGIRNDVFGLEQIYQLQIEGQWSTKGDVWNTPSPFTKAHPFGYFIGGQPNQTNTTERLDYSSDTTVNTFTEQLEENEPDEAELKASQKAFQLDLMGEVFDYNPFLYPVKRLIDLYYKNKNTLTGNILQPLETIKDKGIIPLMKVHICLDILNSRHSKTYMFHI